MNLSDMTPLIALSPLDGRYRSKTKQLVNYLSEAALNRERMVVETEWMIFLSEADDGSSVIPGVKPLSDEEKTYLRNIPRSFDEKGIAEHHAIEAVTHHDVKAVEYYIDRRLDAAERKLGHPTQLTHLAPLVHFACTSEDINNLSYARCVQHAVHDVWLPACDAVLAKLTDGAHQFADLPLLAMTHGQPATPTTLGKELAVFAWRLSRQRQKVAHQEILGKINGATGTFGAHTVVLPNVNWLDLSRRFVTERMGLEWNPLTTQIESHDWMAELFGTIAHANRILHNLCVDMWMYISRGVFTQIPVKGATGSSTMPHKVNPILFENAEANFEISCSFLDTLATTLVESRWQRDLTDSTTQRNIGSAFGYSLLALDNLLTGLTQVQPNKAHMHAELEDNWEVLGEPIQTVMRAEALAGVPGMDHPYEKVKELMRGKRITHADIERFVASLHLPDDVAQRLRNLTPETYIGLAPQLARFASGTQGVTDAQAPRESHSLR